MWLYASSCPPCSLQVIFQAWNPGKAAIEAQSFLKSGYVFTIPRDATVERVDATGRPKQPQMQQDLLVNTTLFKV